MMSLLRRSVAEFGGTFWLVLGGCGSAVLAAGFPGLGIGFAGVALALGLTVLTMAYPLGPISGAHFSPAVSVGLWAGGRFPGRELPASVAAQVAGALAAATVLYLIARGAPGFDPAGGFAANGYGVHSPGHYSLGVAFYAGSWALRQLWLFWLAPLVGGVLGGLGYRVLAEVPPVPLAGSRGAALTQGSPSSPSQVHP
jgi:glycerol uptake facilitator-like aquaporin